MNQIDLAILKMNEAELHLNRRLSHETDGYDEDINVILIELTKLRVRLEANVTLQKTFVTGSALSSDAPSQAAAD